MDHGPKMDVEVEVGVPTSTCAALPVLNDVNKGRRGGGRGGGQDLALKLLCVGSLGQGDGYHHCHPTQSPATIQTGGQTPCMPYRAAKDHGPKTDR